MVKSCVMFLSYKIKYVESTLVCVYAWSLLICFTKVNMGIHIGVLLFMYTEFSLFRFSIGGVLLVLVMELFIFVDIGLGIHNHRCANIQNMFICTIIATPFCPFLGFSPLV